MMAKISVLVTVPNSSPDDLKVKLNYWADENISRITIFDLIHFKKPANVDLK